MAKNIWLTIRQKNVRTLPHSMYININSRYTKNRNEKKPQKY